MSLLSWSVSSLLSLLSWGRNFKQFWLGKASQDSDQTGCWWCNAGHSSSFKCLKLWYLYFCHCPCPGFPPVLAVTYIIFILVRNVIFFFRILSIIVFIVIISSSLGSASLSLLHLHPPSIPYLFLPSSPTAYLVPALMVRSLLEIVTS